MMVGEAKLAPPIAVERPPLLHFGVGTAREVGRFAETAGVRRAVVVADTYNARRVEALGLVCETAVLGHVAAEPDSALLERLLAEVDEIGPDLVIGFGGGSAMDLAKMVAVLYQSGMGVHQVVGVERTPMRRVRLVQVATTAGTGSEAGSRSLITDVRTKAKLAVQSRQIMADVAVLDPLMTATVPPHITAETGIDALTHCVEAFTNVKAHPITDLYAREGIRLVGKYLRRAVEHGDDLEARAGLSLAALYGGYCLGPVNTAAGHAVAYPLSTRHGISHGAANAIIFPHVLAFNAVAVPERTREILDLLGFGVVGDNAVFETVSRYCVDLGVEMSLSRRGVPETELQLMAEEASRIRRLLDNNPRDVTVQDILRIYQAAL